MKLHFDDYEVFEWHPITFATSQHKKCEIERHYDQRVNNTISPEKKVESNKCSSLSAGAYGIFA